MPESVKSPAPLSSDALGRCTFTGTAAVVHVEGEGASLKTEVDGGTVVLEDAHGVVQCAGEPGQTISGDSLTWTKDGSATLAMTLIQTENGTLQVTVGNRQGPDAPTCAPYGWVAYAALVLVLCAVAGLEIWRRRRRRARARRSASPIPRPKVRVRRDPPPPLDRPALVEALLRCATMVDPFDRKQVLTRLPMAIAGHIEYHPSIYAHITSIVDTCAEKPDGLDELRAALAFFEGPTVAMYEVDHLLGYYDTPDDDADD